MRALIDKVLLNPFVLLSVGLVFALIGASGAADVPATLSRARRVEQLQPMAEAAPGQAAFVEGRISNHTPPVYHQFVAYLREEYRSSGARTSHWVQVARKTPPLLIEAHGRAARVVNSDYGLESTDVTVEEEPPTFTRGAIQSRGFVAGSPVLAVGSVAKETEGLVAEFLYAGTHAEYVAYLHRSLQAGLWLGGGLLLGGVGCIILGSWRLLLFMRETTASEKAMESQPSGRIRGSGSVRASHHKIKKRRSKK